MTRRSRARKWMRRRPTVKLVRLLLRAMVAMDEINRRLDVIEQDLDCDVADSLAAKLADQHQQQLWFDARMSEWVQFVATDERA